MSSTTYPIDIPRWLWEIYTPVVDDLTEYSRYNDRLVEAIAIDVRRFAAAGFVDLDEFQERRIDELLDELQPEQENIPDLAESIHGQRAAGGHRSSASDPGGERPR